jgi:hypothetical protein
MYHEADFRERSKVPASRVPSGAGFRANNRPLTELGSSELPLSTLDPVLKIVDTRYQLASPTWFRHFLKEST